MPHVIRQQHLHVQFNGTESQAAALRNRLSHIHHHGLLPVIESTLDTFSPPEGHICIEHLEVDVGKVKLERLDHDLAESLTRALGNSLKEILLPLESPPLHKTPQQSLHEAFIYFLETGTLPWSFQLPPGQDLEQALRPSLQASENAAFIRSALVGELASESAQKRLIRQFSEPFLYLILATISEEGARTVRSISGTVESFPLPPAVKAEVGKRLWEAVFHCISAGSTLSETKIVSRACEALSATMAMPKELQIQLARHWPEAAWKECTYQRHPDGQAVEAFSAKRPDTPPAPTRSAQTGADRHPKAFAGIYLQDAGLVLLHPFLPQLFQALGLAEQDRLLQPERAICLLHFLATGEVTAPEYQAMLPKILCNVPLETPVESDVALTTAEREEASALLQAVIGHWRALGDTSPDALRGTFLQRPGKLSLRGEDWLLQVELQSWDILLEQLPWSISMVKLPWMERMLWVEWR